MDLPSQLLQLFTLAIPVACIAWTVTHEQIFLETRTFCQRKSEESRSVFERKFYYLFTCEYCFSHYVAAIFLIITRFAMVFPDWRGYLVSGFSLVWIANLYMTVFGILRQTLKVERIEGNLKESELKDIKNDKNS